MAYDPSGGYAAAASNVQDSFDPSLPVFDVQRVQLRFDISSDFVAAQVANNVLILALSTGRILRFDLDSPEDIDDIDLPKKPSEIGVIRRLFLDPSASHLVISTTQGENYYLHTQSRMPKPLARLKGVQIESIAWNPSQPTASTREILIGASDGNIYETYIEPSTEFYRREEKYLKTLYNVQDGPVVGLSVDLSSDARSVLVATPTKLLLFVGKGGRQDSGSIYPRLLERETPVIHNLKDATPGPSTLVTISEPADAALSESAQENVFAWLNSQGVFHGDFAAMVQSAETSPFSAAKLLPKSVIPPSQTSGGRNKPSVEPTSSIALTQFHILHLVEGRVVAINRLDGSLVYDQLVLEPGNAPLGLYADHKKNTYWLFTQREIFEVVVTDEARDVWKIMLRNEQFDAASRYAKTAAQKDAVATASGDHLVSRGRFSEAATVYGRSTKPFEEVALTFIDQGEQDALRKYLLTKLSVLKKSSTMQRVMVASWLVELFMAKLNLLDDTISAKAELSEAAPIANVQEDLPSMRREFQEFVTKYRSDLDRKTTYELISSHGREEELLYFANVIDDYNYVLSYWVQRERWQEAMSVLKKQTDPEIFYQYSSVLMTHVAVDLVEVMMRQNNLEANKLIPALLNYNKTADVPLNQNQAVRYLQFCINQRHSTETAVHNTVVSIYAAHPTRDETALFQYLQTQSAAHEQNYDADFALRLCIAHQRVQSCVHIYCTMNQYAQAVDMALKHDQVDLAANVADRPGNDPALRKKLWLKVAKKVIGQSKGIKAAMEFLKRCELLRIEDLIPFFPDFVVIDDFKEEICAALEEYSRQIEGLKREMDESANTAQHIKEDIKSLDQRYAIVEPGEKCWSCRLPLLMRQFFVFPCQHSFHADCLGKMVLQSVGMGKSKRIKELQTEVGRAVVTGKKRERMVKELDALVAGACEMAVKRIDEPFVTANDNKNDWTI
ncbi:hypothetical protein D6D10_08588 [Aureobasidium pullulans]|uniref:Uncharacterized protein n=1 Tax=Aureobasidium pullulans TaxID=5580 RepID=A0A4V4J635_AURPU|nr:hypothetical protein D6D10_08588 [Aureobasidium pullulans]